MTPEVQLALIAAIVPTIAAIGAIVVVIIGNRHADRKADVIVAKVDEVHTVSNGHLTAVTAALAAANEKIGSLEKLVTAMMTVKKQ